MTFKDSFSYQCAVRALESLLEARTALEAAQSGFEDAARHEDAMRPAEAALRAIEDILGDLEPQTDRLRERVDAFDEYDPSGWDGDD